MALLGSASRRRRQPLIELKRTLANTAGEALPTLREPFGAGAAAEAESGEVGALLRLRTLGEEALHPGTAV